MAKRNKPKVYDKSIKHEEDLSFESDKKLQVKREPHLEGPQLTANGLVSTTSQQFTSSTAQGPPPLTFQFAPNSPTTNLIRPDIYDDDPNYTPTPALVNAYPIYEAYMRSIEEERLRIKQERLVCKVEDKLMRVEETRPNSRSHILSHEHWSIANGSGSCDIPPCPRTTPITPKDPHVRPNHKHTNKQRPTIQAPSCIISPTPNSNDDPDILIIRDTSRKILNTKKIIRSDVRPNCGGGIMSTTIGRRKASTIKPRRSLASGHTFPVHAATSGLYVTPDTEFFTPRASPSKMSARQRRYKDATPIM